MADFDHVQDSGARRQFSTGAHRDAAPGKGRFDLISPHMIRRLARHYENGAVKYGDRNWEKGMPYSVFYNSAYRHLLSLQRGMMDEDHAAAVIWNITCIIHFDEEGRTEELDDLRPRPEPPAAGDGLGEEMEEFAEVDECGPWPPPPSLWRRFRNAWAAFRFA